MNDARCYVLLVNWNGWQDTLECLESLQLRTSPTTRVIVCDNGSEDESCERIRAWAAGTLAFVPPVGAPIGFIPPEVSGKSISFCEYDRTSAERGGNTDDDAQLVLIRIGANLGFAGGNNVGLRYLLARGGFDYVWLLNNDTVVAPDALTSLVARMRAKPGAGMCGSTLIEYARPQRIQAYGGGWYCKWIGLPWHLGRLRRVADVPDPDRVERWMNYVVGAALFISREFLEQVGLMCEDYFLYFEEADWALRGRGRFSLAYAPASHVYHKIGRSIGTSSDPRKKSLTCDYYALRNRLLFTRRYYPEALPTIWLSVLTAAGVRLLLGRWRRAWLVLQLLAGHDPNIIPVVQRS